MNTFNPEPEEPLTSFDKDEWKDICRIFHPGLTDERFEQLWDEFQEFKRKKMLQ